MPPKAWNNTSLEEFKNKLRDFSKEREWDQFHTPRNLVLALVGEVGELAERFQWKGEVKTGLGGWKGDEKKGVAEELSDCFLYLVRLADQCNIDLADAANKKMALNAKKYPADVVRGSSEKPAAAKKTKEPKPKVDTSRQVYVSTLKPEMTPALIKEAFAKFGEVAEVNNPPNKNNFCYVEFADAASVEKAVAAGEITIAGGQVKAEARTSSGSRRRPNPRAKRSSEGKTKEVGTAE